MVEAETAVLDDLRGWSLADTGVTKLELGNEEKEKSVLPPASAGLLLRIGKARLKPAGVEGGIKTTS
jgi:hypothetical protein